ncbi:exopolyphosphatase [Sideroxydans lithotrophicus]|uniref:Exopolyphosphatase n=1 Tax=Sideroxydans lithotrophicus (strain ES-1) TaxID=580332 RepID=D5CP35_SIDLE|nr:exopolyphosphatase [Sideroxydans lithotrophicus]ADE12956.1 Ppx/GppA phosphatase [Sideroxydans lithotrophicus ES-1]
MQQSVLAAVDLGSNSFRLQIARVENDQLYMLDGLREPVRLAAGITEDKRLDKSSQQRALACLQRFGERLRGLPREAVRAVGTNSLRVAKNAPEFLQQAEAALGFPIDVIAGREEARLIYRGVAQTLPQSEGKRLVMDIGGGSTEFIIGNGLQPLKLESLYMGCVSYSVRFFPDGKINKSNLKQAELAARSEVQAIASEFSTGHWKVAFGSSGSARVLCDILEQNGYSNGGITLEGLEQLRVQLLKAGDVNKLDVLGLKPDRIPVLPGGFAIMYAAFTELGIERMQPALGALREGLLYDLLGRFHHNDMREVTMQQFMRRYHVDVRQAMRVAHLADFFARQFLEGELGDEDLHLLNWAANLHEIGISVAHSGYHKHTAYILANADMPGFSKTEQNHLSLLALAHRGGLEKLRGMLDTPEKLAQAMALRLAALIYRNRGDVELPAMQGRFSGTKFHLVLAPGWLVQNPLTEAALLEEIKQWKGLGVSMQVVEG